MKRTLIVMVVMTAMVFGVVAYANAAADNTIVSATVNSKVVVTAPADHNFGTFDPDATNQSDYTANVNVRSNKSYTAAHVLAPATGTPAGMFSATVPTNFDGTTPLPKAPSAAGKDHEITWSLDLTPGTGNEWVDPGSYSATSQFTVVVVTP